ncbi:uncharacterized protein LOC100904600 [Galendromus occidentalis]|uniref:Uncharacterized protein LOC100904600 n=1 Tax=Galendromus occidentalis TaxID=34638 RepID=A0AAJ6VVM7_9ACAR|nr:uncharacterized protein LOC100904600 [Galendromus occidentalis]
MSFCSGPVYRKRRHDEDSSGSDRPRSVSLKASAADSRSSVKKARKFVTWKDLKNQDESRGSRTGSWIEYRPHRVQIRKSKKSGQAGKLIDRFRQLPASFFVHLSQTPESAGSEWEIDSIEIKVLDEVVNDGGSEKRKERSFVITRESLAAGRNRRASAGSADLSQSTESDADERSPEEKITVKTRNTSQVAKDEMMALLRNRVKRVRRRKSSTGSMLNFLIDPQSDCSSYSSAD